MTVGKSKYQIFLHFNENCKKIWYNYSMNAFQWIIFGILNLCETAPICCFIISTYFLLSIIDAHYTEKIYLLILISFFIKFVIFPVLYEILNHKSQIFIFLNKLKKLKYALLILLAAYILNLISLKLPLFKEEASCFSGICSLFICYLSLVIWLKLRKCIFYNLRKVIKRISKWLTQRKFATLKNIIILLNLIFAAELTIISFVNVNSDIYNMVFIALMIIPLAFIELISVLSFTKNQKAQPFQRGIIFLTSLLLFIYTQIALFLSI